MSDILPLFPLELVLLPGMPLPLHVFEPRYKEMVHECMRQKSSFGIVRLRGAEEGQARQNQLAEVGCTAKIVDLLRTYPDGRLDVIVTGGERFELLALNEERSFVRAEVAFFADEEEESEIPEPLRRSVLEMHSEVALLTKTGEPNVDLESGQLSFQLLSALPVDLDFKQLMLEMRSEGERLRTLLDYYQQIIPHLKMMESGRKRASGNGWVN